MIVIIKIKEHTEQVLHSVIAQHPLTDAQIVSEQQFFSLNQLYHFVV